MSVSAAAPLTVTRVFSPLRKPGEGKAPLCVILSDGKSYEVVGGFEEPGIPEVGDQAENLQLRPWPKVANRFEDLEVIADQEGNSVVRIGNLEWGARLWDSGIAHMRELHRAVPAGIAVLAQGPDDYVLTIRRPDVERGSIEYRDRHPGLRAAALAAEVFAWDVIDHAGLRWYRTGPERWSACLGAGDVAKVWKDQHDGTYSMKREFSPRVGEFYEVSAFRYKNDDSDRSVTSFEEAAAIAVSMPLMLSVWMKSTVSAQTTGA